MDQLKNAFSALKKHFFWLLCLLILGLYIGTWFMSTSSMTKATEARAATISSAFSTGDRIAKIQNHPNPASAEMMSKLNREEAEQVRLAWERRFREQEDVLVWPQELLPDFIAAVEPLKPIEAKVEFPTPKSQELKMEFRNRYRDYIRKELPKLAEIIGAEWGGGQQSPGGGMGMPGMASGGGYPGMSSGTGPSGGAGYPGMASGGGAGYPGMASGGGAGYPGMASGGGAGNPGMSSSGGAGYPGMGGYPGMSRGSGGGSDLLTSEGKPIVVVWSPANQAALQATSMNWTSPTTLQVLYAQEDLWVLRALMLIIKATNGDADAQYNAAVKEILSIELGAMAAGFKFVGQVGAGGAAGGMYGGGMYPGAGGGGMMSGSPSGPGGAMGSGGPMAPGGGGSPGAASPSSGGGPSSMSPYASMGGGDVDPAGGRYVDDKNEPLAGDRLRTAIKSDQPADAFLAVAKRMPMRMRVRMNVLKLPLLLCEFSQANLPVEVRQVRINTSAGGGMTGSSGTRGFGGGPPTMSGPAMPDAAASGPRGGSGGMAPGGMAGGGMAGGMMSGGMMSGGMGSGGMGSGGMGSGGMGYPGMGGSSGGAASALSTESPYDATVEIYGIIYIYNPVDPAKLGIQQDDKADAADAAGGAAPQPTTESSAEVVTGSAGTSAAGTSAGLETAAPAADTPAADGATDAAGDGDESATPPAADGAPPADATAAPATSGEPPVPADESTAPAAPAAGGGG